MSPLRLEATLRLLADELHRRHDGFRASWILGVPTLNRGLKDAGLRETPTLRRRLKQLLEERHGVRAYQSNCRLVLRARDHVGRWTR